MNILLAALFLLTQATSLIWERDFGTLTAAPLLVDEVLYISTIPTRGSTVLYALDADTGADLWQANLPAPVITAPAYDDNNLYMGTDNGGVYALNRTDGAVQWHVDLPGLMWFTPLRVADQLFLAGAGTFYSLDVDNGTILWEFDLAGQEVYYAPAYTNGMLYFAADQTLYALDTSGEESWRLAADTYWTTPVVQDGVLYIGSEDGAFTAMDTQTQEIIWQFTDGGRGWSRPVIGEDAVFVGNIDNTVFAFNRSDGTLHWQFETADWATSPLVLVEDVLYFGVGNHEGRSGSRPFYALDALTGELRWQFEADGLIHIAPAYGAGRIYFNTTTGNVYAIEEQ